MSLAQFCNLPLSERIRIYRRIIPAIHFRGLAAAYHSIKILYGDADLARYVVGIADDYLSGRIESCRVCGLSR